MALATTFACHSETQSAVFMERDQLGGGGALASTTPAQVSELKQARSACGLRSVVLEEWLFFI